MKQDTLSLLTKEEIKKIDARDYFEKIHFAGKYTYSSSNDNAKKLARIREKVGDSKARRKALKEKELKAKKEVQQRYKRLRTAHEARHKTFLEKQEQLKAKLHANRGHQTY